MKEMFRANAKSWRWSGTSVQQSARSSRQQVTMSRGQPAETRSNRSSRSIHSSGSKQDKRDSCFGSRRSTPAILFLRSVSRAGGPVIAKSSPCVIPETLCAFMSKQVLRAEPQLVSQTLEMFLPITLPVACGVTCAIHALLQQYTFQVSTLLLSTGNRTSTSV